MKNKIVKFRVSSLELNVLKMKAEHTGLTVSEYVRNRSFNYTIVGKLTEEEMDCYKNLSKFSDNFRRIANLFKLGDTTGVKEEAVKTSQLIKDHLNKLK